MRQFGNCNKATSEADETAGPASTLAGIRKSKILSERIKRLSFSGQEQTIKEMMKVTTRSVMNIPDRSFQK